MAEKRVIELEIKSDSVGTLKSQLKAAQNEVNELAAKFGATSQEAVNAAKRAAELKDAIADAKTDEEVAMLKRKIDISFKEKRPRLVQALNVLINDAIVNNKSLVEDSVKLYKGFSE